MGFGNLFLSNFKQNLRFILQQSHIQLKRINTATRADFIDRFKKDFFKEFTRDIMAIKQYDALIFKVRDIQYGEDIPIEEFPYFGVDDKIFKQLNKFFQGKEIYSAYELDDVLFGHIDDLGTFEKRGVLDISFIYEFFDYYIEVI